MTYPLKDPRLDNLRRATEDREWDVIVIGGGASGLGTALEAASRGYKTLLLEAHDYAKGTSSRSTKLIHGGVRYLAQGRLRFLRESLRERGLLMRNAPHLVNEWPFLIAVYSGWRLPFYGLGLALYDLLAGRLNLKPSHRLNRAEALAQVPTLQATDLKGGILYFDGQFNDSRLAITLLRTLLGQGGVALNAAPVTGLLKQEGKIAGVRFMDRETGKTYEARAKAVINATGIFADAVRVMDDPAALPMLTLSQGAHVVVGKHFLPSDVALMIPKTDDGRVLFAIPWQGRTLIGTTETPIAKADLEPRPLEAEIDFILQTVASYIQPAPGKADVLSIFAGQRPLVKSNVASDTKTLSREHVIAVSESGLLTLAGGKWTTYRRMGEEMIDRAEAFFGWPSKPSGTSSLKLHGWVDTPEEGHGAAYGSDADAVKALPGATQRLHPDFPYSEAEVRWAVRHEQARTVEDVLARRLRLLFLDAAASMTASHRVAEIIAEELGRDNAWIEGQLKDFTSLATGYL